MPRWWSWRWSQGLAPPPTRTHNSASGCVFSAPAVLVMPASADEENRSATADPLARTVASVLVQNALPGEIDHLDQDRLHAIAAFAFADIAERPPDKSVVQVAIGEEGDRAEEHPYDITSRMRIAYAIFRLK